MTRELIVMAHSNGQWHLIETITLQETGSETKMWKAARGLEKAVRKQVGVTETRIDAR